MNRGESLLCLYYWLRQQHLSVNPQPLGTTYGGIQADVRKAGGEG